VEATTPGPSNNGIAVAFTGIFRERLQTVSLFLCFRISEFLHFKPSIRSFFDVLTKKPAFGSGFESKSRDAETLQVSCQANIVRIHIICWILHL
jgi:hypothetical protein